MSVLVTLEIRDLLCVLRENGGTLAQAEAIISASADRAVRRRCERAIKSALFPRPANDLVPSVETAREDEAPPVKPRNGDKIVPVSDRLGPKQIARKALLLAPGLTAQDKAVLAALIDRADIETGRCWPSRSRIAADAGIRGRQPERAVLRAVSNAEIGAKGRECGHNNRLIERRVRGGGRGRATVYVVDWQRFAELLAQCEGRSDQPPMFAAMRRNRDTIAAVNGDNRDNRDNGVPPTHKEITTSLPEASQQRARSRSPAPNARQREFVYPMPSSERGVHAAARRRLMAAFAAEPAALAFLEREPDVVEVCTHEELTPGKGVAYARTILERRGIGPPAAVLA